MNAVEFEVDVHNNVIEIPAEYKRFHSRHVKVILLIDDPVAEVAKFDFSDLRGQLKWQGDAVAEQRRLRDEWE